MTIVTPKNTRFDISDRKFYALSHLWRTDPNENLWQVNDFIDDEDGTIVAPIPMRQEKRKALLNLLQDYPGYWWIDVLCHRSKAPPVIMRGVYGCCVACFAMIDCSSEALQYFSFTFSKLIREHSYNNVHLNEGHDYTAHWNEALCDPIKSAKEAWQCFKDISNCRWFCRVWTLQEMVLPKSVMLLSETCDMHGFGTTISVDSLISNLDALARTFPSMVSSDAIRPFIMGWKQEISDFANAIFVLRREFRAFHGRNIEESNGPNYRYDRFCRIFQSFDCKRSCYIAQDYVYGVLGILGWDIPRMDDMKNLWERFLSTLQHFSEYLLLQYLHGHEHFKKTLHVNISEGARLFALSDACYMADIYRLKLLYIDAECSCDDCNKSIRDLALDPYFSGGKGIASMMSISSSELSYGQENQDHQSLEQLQQPQRRYSSQDPKKSNATSSRRRPSCTASVQFSYTVLIYETFSSEEYDRKCDTRDTCQHLTPSTAMHIKQELNEFKLVEMQVHESSRCYTHFFL
ncbi:hypothetical protein K492DRAFT_42987 [Lichtheimia hyalospora FSU 10163]|nr:hypothetical protein K492DRAFT_42987 [Lichtheimia hyalospora FSU 10163]